MLRAVQWTARTLHATRTVRPGAVLRMPLASVSSRHDPMGAPGPTPATADADSNPRAVKRCRVDQGLEGGRSTAGAAAGSAPDMAGGVPAPVDPGAGPAIPANDIQPTPTATTTTVYSLHKGASEAEFETVVAAVSDKLKKGEVVGLPTDTIYGVACLAQLTPAINRVYAIKGRVSGKPIAICVAETGDVATYAEVTVSPEVLRELLPGPVTLVFKRTPMLNPELNPSSETIGIRIPDDRFIRALTTACGTSLALTSANLSGHCSSIQVISSAPALPRFSPFFDSPAPSLPAPLLPAQHHRRHPSCRVPSTRR
eukprot:m.35360 g.35360  ORF g.35360 m.35360 type:complete len:313 (-) comp12767_c0_seq1:56-994(-)